MAARKNQDKRFSPIALVFWIVFLISGAAGLIYEILWVRFFALNIGSTIYAASAVTAAYMAGLALGAWILGRFSDRAGSPLKWYAIFELLIGAYALLFSGCSSLVQSLCSDLGSIYSKFFFVMAALIIPTLLMGATLPFISSAYVRIFKPVNNELSVSYLYGINALGGVIGIFLATFFLIYRFGNTITMLSAVACNFLVAIAAFLIARSTESIKTSVEPQATPTAVDEIYSVRQNAYEINPLISFTGFFTVGFCALALEIVLTRLLILVIGSSTYAFSLILMAYICAIPIGSIIIPSFMKRPPRAAAFGVVLMLLAIASLATIPCISAAPFIFLKIYSIYHTNFSSFMALQYLLCFIILLPPAALSGYAFTCALGSIKSESVNIGSKVGRLYFFNTIGAVLGSITAPFIFIKSFGLQNSIITLSLLYLVSGIAFTLATNAKKRLKLLRIVSFALIYTAILFGGGELDMEIIASGVHHQPEKYDGKTIAEIKNQIKKDKLIFLAEGIDSTVGIYSRHEVIYLKINGKTDASTGWYDMNTQLLLGHLPMMLAKKNKNVAIIGLGAGVTAGAVMKYDPESLDCLEINPNVIDSARYFTKISGLDFTAKNFKIIEEDALAYIKNTKKKYDVIISEPSNPWIAGIASLFTYDHFEKCREKLSDDGLMCQWLQIYSMSHEDFIRVLITFQKAFPNATLWYSSWGDALIIATRSDYEFDYNLIKKRFENDIIKKHLNLTEVFSPEAVLAHQILDAKTLTELAKKYPEIEINTHEHQILEFSAPINYYRQSSEQITSALLSMQKPDLLYLKKYFDLNQAGEYCLESLARVYYKLKMFDKARNCFKIASDKNPALWLIHLKKAEMYYNEKLLYEAINEVQIALFLAPEKHESYYAFLKIAIELKDFYSITSVFKNGEKFFTGHDKYQYYLALGVGYEGIDETDDAISCYKKALEIYPDCFSAHKNLGMIYFKQINFTNAKKYLNNAYKLKSDDGEILETLTKLHGGK